MSDAGLHVTMTPKLRDAVLIAGFLGWGNALDVSGGMVDYLIKTLEAKYFARFDPDTYYHYDETRPAAAIEDGVFKRLTPLAASFYFVNAETCGRDLVLLKAQEPGLRWYDFTDKLYSVCESTGVETVITLGSMYDNVLHSERTISGLASDRQLLGLLMRKNVIPITYHGPGAVHSLVQLEGEKRGLKCMSLWCHCPFYLEGTAHYGVLAALGALLADVADFELDVTSLAEDWRLLEGKIESLIRQNPKVQSMIAEIRETRKSEAMAQAMQSVKKGDKVIDLRDFLETS